MKKAIYSFIFFLLIIYVIAWVSEVIEKKEVHVELSSRGEPYWLAISDGEREEIEAIFPSAFKEWEKTISKERAIRAALKGQETIKGEARKISNVFLEEIELRAIKNNNIISFYNVETKSPLWLNLCLTLLISIALYSGISFLENNDKMNKGALSYGVLANIPFIVVAFKTEHIIGPLFSWGAIAFCLLAIFVFIFRYRRREKYKDNKFLIIPYLVICSLFLLKLGVSFFSAPGVVFVLAGFLAGIAIFLWQKNREKKEEA